MCPSPWNLQYVCLLNSSPHVAGGGGNYATHSNYMWLGTFSLLFELYFIWKNTNFILSCIFFFLNTTYKFACMPISTQALQYIHLKPLSSEHTSKCSAVIGWLESQRVQSFQFCYSLLTYNSIHFFRLLRFLNFYVIIFYKRSITLKVCQISTIQKYLACKKRKLDSFIENKFSI